MLTRLVDDLLAPVARGLAVLGGALVLLSAVLVGVEVVLRNLFALSVVNSFEITIYLFAASTAFAFSYALVERAHIRIDILYAHVPPIVRAVSDVASLLGLAAVASLLSHHAWRTFGTSLSLGAVSNSSLAVPMVIPQGVWAAALTWFAVTAVVLFLDATVALARGRVGEVARRAGVPSSAPETGMAETAFPERRP